MKQLALSLTALAALFLAFGPSTFAQDGDDASTTNVEEETDPVGEEEEEVGAGTIKACGKAPGKDPSVEIKKNGGNPGGITVTSVTINGQVVDSDNYTVNDQDSSSPEVVFHSPDPGPPAEGAEICVYGTTNSGDKEFEGKLDW